MGTVGRVRVSYRGGAKDRHKDRIIVSNYS